MGIVESAQFAQDQYQHTEIIKYERKAFKNDGRSYNLDLISTLREDLRDLCSQQYNQIDTVMLISTLTLSISFGFVYKGTFPGGWDGIDYFNDKEFRWYTPILMIYSALMACSIILPFWSIWAALQCKNTLDYYCHRILDVNLAGGRMDLNTWLDQYDYFEHFWEDKCKWNFNLAYKSFWAGVIFCFMTVVVLLGINFYHCYELPVFIIFTSIVGGNMVFATVRLIVADPFAPKIVQARRRMEDSLGDHVRRMSEVTGSPSADVIMDSNLLQESIPDMRSPDQIQDTLSDPGSPRPLWETHDIPEN